MLHLQQRLIDFLVRCETNRNELNLDELKDGDTDMLLACWKDGGNKCRVLTYWLENSKRDEVHLFFILTFQCVWQQ